MNKYRLHTKGLRVYYHTLKGIVKAVDDVNLNIGPEEFVGLVGESGCGKSTVALSLMGILPPHVQVGGEIMFEGIDLLKLKADEMRLIRGDRISIVFQDPVTYLNPVLKVGDQIAETIGLHTENKGEEKSIAVEWLKKTGISSAEEVAKSYPHELSGGMNQRVLIAIAICTDPQLMIMDEPTSALDVTTQAQILKLINQLRETMKSSLLLITHDFGLVAELCDRVYVMYAGKIVESGNVFEIFEAPLHPYTKGLLDCVRSIEGLTEELKTIEGCVPSLIDRPAGCPFHPRCPKVLPICFEKEPVAVGSEHEVYCWLYGEKP